MSTYQKYLKSILLFRWQAIAILICALSLWLFAQFALPQFKTVGKDVSKTLETLRIANKADSIATLATNLKTQANTIDSLVSAGQSGPSFTEGTLPGAIYEYAGKSGVKAGRVEIAVSNGAADNRSIPVRFYGSGDYIACGKFIDMVENIKPTTRIKQLTMKHTGKGSIELFMDFSVMGK